MDLEDVPAGTMAVPDETYDPLEANNAFGSSGSVLEDLIKRSSHDHTLYKTDNAMMYGLIEQAYRTLSYLERIKPFQNHKGGA